ncbi:MAG: hypothetical protein GY804_10830 [Alphaproteobacteria bacterium]|nr:hypothetical protein [Alphaproteobacteria bacterium]
MKRFGLIFAVLALVFVTGCKTLGTPFKASSASSTTATEGGIGDSPVAPAFSQFSDIPIPDNAVMNLERTLLLGSEGAWIGRLSISAPYGTSGLFDFYMSEMPRFGWTEVTVIRSQTSVLTYKRNNRVATIQLIQENAERTDVLFTVSPEGRGGKSINAPAATGAPVKGANW